MNQTLSFTMGPPSTTLASYTDRVPLLVIAPAALSASLMLSDCRSWLVPLANRVPLKRLPPSRGITLSTTPLLVYSADVLPVGVSTTISCEVSAFTKKVRPLPSPSNQLNDMPSSSILVSPCFDPCSEARELVSPLLPPTSCALVGDCSAGVSA